MACSLIEGDPVQEQPAGHEVGDQRLGRGHHGRPGGTVHESEQHEHPDGSQVGEHQDAQHDVVDHIDREHRRDHDSPVEPVRQVAGQGRHQHPGYHCRERDQADPERGLRLGPDEPAPRNYEGPGCGPRRHARRPQRQEIAVRQRLQVRRQPAQGSLLAVLLGPAPTPGIVADRLSGFAKCRRAPAQVSTQTVCPDSPPNMDGRCVGLLPGL